MSSIMDSMVTHRVKAHVFQYDVAGVACVVWVWDFKITQRQVIPLVDTQALVAIFEPRQVTNPFEVDWDRSDQTVQSNIWLF